ncbi:MAG: hypothetical protein WBG70_17420 [Spirulinaceae cyanobacterium]
MNSQDIKHNNSSVLSASSVSGDHSSLSTIFLVVIASFIFGLIPIIAGFTNSGNQNVPVIGEAGVWSSLGK